MTENNGGWGADFLPPDLLGGGDSSTATLPGGWDDEFLPPDLAHTSATAKEAKRKQYADDYAAMADQIEQQRANGPKPWDLPPNATELETLNAKRLKQLYTGDAENLANRRRRIAYFQDWYDTETDPERKKEALLALVLERRHEETDREFAAADRADMLSRGITPEQKIMEARYKAESDPDGRLINAPVMRGAMTGVSNAASGIGEIALRLLPGEGAPSEMADVLGRTRMAEGQYQAFLDEKQGTAAALPNAVSQMTAEYLPLAASGVPAWLQVGAKGANDAYLKSDSDAYALTSGVIQGAATFFGGKLAGGTWIDMLSGKVAGKTIGPMLKGFGIESGEELSQLYLQALVDRGFGVGDGKMPTMKDAMWTLAVTAGARGFGSIMSGGIEDDGTPTVLSGDRAINAADRVAGRAANAIQEKVKAFVDSERPTRKQAEELGVDQVAPSAKDRVQLATDIRNRLSAEDFKSQLRAAESTEGEADALVDIYAARARSAGESLDDYIGRRIKGVEKTTRDAVRAERSKPLPDSRRGEIEFLAEGRAIIRAFESQRVNTLIHETGHLFRRDLKGPQLVAAEKWAGVKDGKWDEKAEEKWARGFERYMRTGRGPTNNVKAAFAKYKTWLTNIYKSITGGPLDVGFNREIRQVYDSLFLPGDGQVETPAETTPPAKGVAGNLSGNLATEESTGKTPISATSPATFPATDPDILAENRGLSPTSIKNATVDEERAKRGLPPVMQSARQSDPAAWDEAMRKIDSDPRWLDDLQAELTESPRAPSKLETAGLLHRRVTLRNEWHDALEKWQDAKAAGNTDLAAELDQRVTAAADRLADFEQLTKDVGSESGRSLQARKMMASEDYSLETMIAETAHARGGTLTAEEQQEVVDQNKKIVEKQRQLDEHEAVTEAAEETKAVAEAMEEAKKPAPGKKPTPGKNPQAAADPQQDIDAAIAAIKAKVDKEETSSITPFVQKLAKLFWQQGIREQEPMIDALHGVLEPMIPGWTRDQTQRAFSGYGNFSPLSKDEMSVGLRDLKGQTQQLLKIEALEARKPLEKTGVERRQPSFEERRLQKIVNELKRKYGVVVTDPETQLKSALEARKTYYRNRLVDLKQEIDSRQRVIKDKSPSPSDPELESLIAEYREVQTQHKEIFGKREMTDAERLKLALAAAEKTEARWQERLAAAKEGKFDPATGEKRKLTSPELEAVRARSEAIREEVELLKSLDSNINEQRQVDLLAASLADVEAKIKSGDIAAPKRPFGPDSKAVSELKGKLDAARDRLKAMREAGAEYKQKQLDAAKAATQAAIDSLAKRIAAGDISVSKSGKAGPVDSELKLLRYQREYLNKVMADLRNAAKPKKTAEQIALQSLKARMKNEAAKLAEKLAAGDFTETPRKPGPKLDAEGAKLKAELDMLRAEYKAGLEKARWERKSVWEKTKRQAVDVYDLDRLLMTTGEMSFLLRQGKFKFLGHPIRGIKAMGSAFRAMLNEETARAIENEIFSHPEFEQAKADRLHLTDEDSSMNKQEEFLVSRLAGNLGRGLKGAAFGATSGAIKGAVTGLAAGNPILGGAIGATIGAGAGGLVGFDAFQRAGRVFMNKLRFDDYLTLKKSLTRTGTGTDEERRMIAMSINEATGRGGLGPLEPSAVALGRMMFSPRYLASRFQYPALHPLWGGSSRSRKIIAHEYARTLIGMGAYYGLLIGFLSLLRDDVKVETDSRSSDFLKIRAGETRLDPLAGLQQVAVLLSRTRNGETKNKYGKVVPLRGPKAKGRDWYDMATDFARTKAHPTLGKAINLLTGMDLAGKPVTATEELAGAVAPITYEDIYDALREHGLAEGGALGLLAFFGEGLQHYGKN